MIPPFYLINLDRSADRLASVRGEFERIGQPFRRIPAIDGAEVPPSYLSWVSQELAVQEGNLRLIPGKIGCHLSHLKTARIFLDSGAPMAVVCEDDVTFRPGFIETLQEVLTVATDWDMIKLSACSRHFTITRARLSDGTRVVEFVRVPGNATCYVINRSGARKLLAGSRPVVMPFDRSLQRVWLYDMVFMGLDRRLADGLSGQIPSEITGPVDADWWQEEKQRRKHEQGILNYFLRKQYLNARTYWRTLRWAAHRHGYPRILFGLLGSLLRRPFTRRGRPRFPGSPA